MSEPVFNDNFVQAIQCIAKHYWEKNHLFNFDKTSIIFRINFTELNFLINKNLPSLVNDSYAILPGRTFLSPLVC